MKKASQLSVDKFSSVTRKDVIKWLEDGSSGWRKQNKLFYEGEHWQEGDGWIGPLTEGGGEEITDVTTRNIEKRFISKGAIKETVDREVHSAVGIAPTVSFLSDGQTDEVVEGAKEYFQGWWDKRDAHELLENSLVVACWGERAAYRAYVPRGLLNENGEIPAVSKEEALDYIFMEVLEPDSSGVYIDPDTNDECRFALWHVDKKNGKKEEHTELVFLDTMGKTVIRHIVDDISTQFAYDLGGKFTIYQIERDLFVSPQMVSLQKAINLNLTMLVTNLILAGFLERIILNASPPGKYVDDPENPTLKKFVPDPFYVGASTTNMLVGLETTDFEGNKRITSPEVKYRDPVPVNTFADSKDLLYQSLLEEAHQIHVLINRDGNASAESRKQARSEFERAVLISANEAEDAVRWMASIVLNLASLISKDNTYYGFRTIAQANIDSGPANADEERSASSLAKDEIISRQEAMRRVGVRDTNAMTEQIERERRLGEGALESIIARWKTFVSLVAVGIPPETAFESVMSWDSSQLKNFGTQKLAQIKLQQEDTVEDVER